jgi:hypothetical protein
MNCAEVCHNLGAFVLGGLEPEESAEVLRHLSLCPNCQNERRELERMSQALETAPPPADPPGYLKGEILSQVRGDKESSSSVQKELSPARNPRIALTAGAAAAVVIVLALGIFLQVTPPVTSTVQLVPTPALRDEDEDYWGVAELHRQPSGSQLVELKLNNLDEPKPGSFYEMWFASGGRHVSAGTFTTTGSGETKVWLTAPPEARDYRTLLITEEPAADNNPSLDKGVVLKGEVPQQ